MNAKDTPDPQLTCRWAGELAPVLRALLTALQGGSVTLRRCDVAAAGEAAAVADAADILLHAGGVLQVGFQPSTMRTVPSPQVPLPH